MEELKQIADLTLSRRSKEAELEEMMKQVKKSRKDIKTKQNQIDDYVFQLMKTFNKSRTVKAQKTK